MSEMLDAAGVQCTADLPVSLSVISFQSVPPHCGPGAASTRAPAGTAKAAETAATAAAAARTNRMARTSESSIERAAGTDASSALRGTDLYARRSTGCPLPRQLDAQDAEQDEERDARDPEREHEPRALRLAQP